MLFCSNMKYSPPEGSSAADSEPIGDEEKLESHDERIKYAHQSTVYAKLPHNIEPTSRQASHAEQLLSL